MTGSPSEASGSGQTAGEAKWAAMQEIRASFPAAEAEDVRFEVVSDESEGVFLARAQIDVGRWRARQADRELPGSSEELARGLVSRVVNAMGLRASTSVERREAVDELVVAVNGPDLGVLIGKGGRTIDAVQAVAYQAVRGRDDRPARLSVDAGGYRERRRLAVERSAARAADEAVRYRREVELEPMPPAERRTAHTYLAENAKVETHSEGEGPDRRVVVVPTS